MKSVRILAGALLAVTLVSAWGSAASAHVTVQPNTAEQGSRGRFVFRVPNESDTASTIKLEVQFPKENAAAFSGVRVMPKEGWDVELVKAPLDPPVQGESGEITQYVDKVTWTAKEGYKIGPDQFDEFSFTTGPLPKDKTSIAFKAIQHYDGPLADGSTEARWVEVRQEGQKDPRRPEPLVKLTPPTSTDEAAAAPSAQGDTAGESGSAAATAADDAASSASTAKTIGTIGLVLGVIALLVAIGAIVTKPKAGAAASASTTKDPESADA